MSAWEIGESTYGIDEGNLTLSAMNDRAQIPDKDIVDAYRVMLRRAPESAEVLAHWKQSNSIGHVYEQMRQSDEFFLVNSFPGYFHAIDRRDVALLRKFKKPGLTGTPGMATDFVGSKTDIRFASAFKNLSGAVEGLPLPMNYHAMADEWIGALRSVDEANTSFKMIELGAGWAPWLMICASAARDKGIQDIRLVGVEGDSTHVDYMHQHFQNNRFDPDAHQLLNAVAAPKTGFALFPIVDQPENVYGSEPIFTEDRSKAEAIASGDNAKKLKYQILDAYSVEDLIGDLPFVDLLHIDIQGGEADVLEAVPENVLNRVGRVVIGTHGRNIEERLQKLFLRLNWICEKDEACRFTLGAKPVLSLDGTQVWKNLRRPS